MDAAPQVPTHRILTILTRQIYSIFFQIGSIGTTPLMSWWLLNNKHLCFDADVVQKKEKQEDR